MLKPDYLPERAWNAAADYLRAFPEVTPEAFSRRDKLFSVNLKGIWGDIPPRLLPDVVLHILTNDFDYKALSAELREINSQQFRKETRMLIKKLSRNLKRLQSVGDENCDIGYLIYQSRVLESLAEIMPLLNSYTHNYLDNPGIQAAISIRQRKKRNDFVRNCYAALPRLASIRSSPKTFKILAAIANEFFPDEDTSPEMVRLLVIRQLKKKKDLSCRS